MQETMQLIDGCRRIRFDDLPPEVIDRSKYLMLDYLGVVVRGSTTPSAACAQSLVRRLGSVGRSRIAGTHLSGDPLYAALANGIAAHSIECDDVVNAASLHPAVTVFTSALSAADLAGGCSGRDVIAAIVAGYEMTIRLGVAVNPAAHYRRGFHPTATCGTFGAAVTAARILKLNRRQTADAIGIAGSQAAGSMAYLTDGVYTKRFHAGWAAHSGLCAALLAADGFSGPHTIFEDRFGFFNGYSDAPQPQKLFQSWQDPYRLMLTSIKPYACCRYKQGPIDCILAIVRENGLAAGDIQRIRTGILSAGMALVADPIEKKRRPQTIVDAQFSMPFGAAAAVLFGNASLDVYTAENLQSAAVQDLMQRVSCFTDPALDACYPERWPAAVEIETGAGRLLKTHIDYPRGDPENPLSREDVTQKFRHMVAPVLPPQQAQAIVEAVQALENQTDVADLTALLAA